MSTTQLSLDITNPSITINDAIAKGHECGEQLRTHDGGDQTLSVSVIQGVPLDVVVAAIDALVQAATPLALARVAVLKLSDYALVAVPVKRLHKIKETAELHLSWLHEDEGSCEELRTIFSKMKKTWRVTHLTTACINKHLHKAVLRRLDIASNLRVLAAHEMALGFHLLPSSLEVLRCDRICISSVIEAKRSFPPPQLRLKRVSPEELTVVLNANNVGPDVLLELLKFAGNPRCVRLVQRIAGTPCDMECFVDDLADALEGAGAQVLQLHKMKLIDESLCVLAGIQGLQRIEMNRCQYVYDDACDASKKYPDVLITARGGRTIVHMADDNIKAEWHAGKRPRLMQFGDCEAGRDFYFGSWKNAEV